MIPAARFWFVKEFGAWLDRVDPDANGRIKGLRLVTAYGIAALLGALPQIAGGLPAASALSSLAGGFALWASVSEARTTRPDSTRDLAVLCVAAACGAMAMLLLAPWLGGVGRPGAELVLVSGAFLVGTLKRFGVLGAGVGSQIYIGQLLAYGAKLVPGDAATVGVAGVIAAVAAIVPRLLSGPAEQPPIAWQAATTRTCAPMSAEFRMGLQAAAAALVIVALNQAIGLTQSAWAITACTYVVAGSAAGTMDRVRRRIAGTLVGVPLGLVCVPLAIHLPLLTWLAASVAMVIYAVALPRRYDVACAAYAFTLMVTLAATGEHATRLLAARAWETLVGRLIGLAAAMLVLPLRATGR